MPSPSSAWVPPPVGSIKLNVEEGFLVAFGYVIRDNVGTLIEATSFGFACAAADPLYVKAGAILWGGRL